ncbi:MAG: LuxR C-terminal-related transcriptional regulator [Planctomycetota bacterium]|nr:LuxR C-terminal-related transcriptional regulator [Planctomycetota bacterium]
MTETYQSNCFWLTSSIPGNMSALAQSLASHFKIETHKIGSDADYQVLGRQLPAHVVVLDATGDDASTSAELLAARIGKVVAHGNQPTIVCLGNHAPTDQIVDWMRQSIFAYAETNSPEDRVARLLRAAFEQADSVLSRFQRFQVLNTRKASMTLPEKAVLEMILEGVPNKTIATELAVSQRTIEARRHKLYLKMGAKSLSGVVQSICEWKELAVQFEGLNPSQPKREFAKESAKGCGGESEQPPKSVNTNLIHSSESIATPKLQATVRQHQQQLDTNCS